MENQKKVILNPVLDVPWLSTPVKMKKYEDPALFVNSKKCARQQKPLSLSARQRLTNMELLLARFPGLKKCEARAALTIAQNRLEKAIVLLEVSNCYRQVTGKQSDTSFLKNIHINVRYDSKRPDPTLRNVVFESSYATKNPIRRRVRGNSTDVTSEDSDVRSPGTQRVGVLIKKTESGYVATPFDEMH